MDDDEEDDVRGAAPWRRLLLSMLSMLFVHISYSATRTLYKSKIVTNSAILRGLVLAVVLLFLLSLPPLRAFNLFTVSLFGCYRLTIGS